MAIIIVAGGGGTRLWPISTPERPKQFVKILNDKSLIEQTYDNLIQEFDPSDIWVSTNEKYKELVIETLPTSFDPNHVITEPEKRDSYGAVIAAAAVVAATVGDDEPLIFLPCDDHLLDQASVAEFNTKQRLIHETVKGGGYNVLIAGVKALEPNTNYGYIELNQNDKLKVFSQAVPVKSFKEKPDEATARQFVDSGNFLWNKFNFAFSYSALKSVLKTVDTKSLSILSHFYDSKSILLEYYTKLPKVAFDVAVLENMDSGLGVAGMDIRWDDLGTWESVYNHLENSAEIEEKGENNKSVTMSGKNVAFVGVSNLMLIESEHGILVLDPRSSSDVKKVVEKID